MGVLEASREADFFEEAVGAQRAGDLGPEDLDRHLARMLEVPAEIDGCHAPAPEFALDHVAICEAGLEKGKPLRMARRSDGLGHGASARRGRPTRRTRLAKRESECSGSSRDSALR